MNEAELKALDDLLKNQEIRDKIIREFGSVEKYKESVGRIKDIIKRARERARRREELKPSLKPNRPDCSRE